MRVPGVGVLDGVQQPEKLSLARGWRDVIGDIVVEDDQPGGIALQVGHVAERRGDEARVIQLGDRVRAIAHGGRSIEQDQKLRIGFPAIPLEEAFVGAREDIPIDVPKIVALRIGAILGELLGESEVGRAMQSRHKPIDDGLGDQVEAGDGGKGGGVKESLEHGGFVGAEGTT